MEAPLPPECILLTRPPTCIVMRAWASVLETLSLREVRYYLTRGNIVALFVDDWETPWRCFLSEEGELYARCPNASHVVSRVVQVARTEDWKLYS